MKYGGQGGWRAIKRLNRDARIASGQSPYGNGFKNVQGGGSIGPFGWAFIVIFGILASPFILIGFLWKKSQESTGERDIKSQLQEGGEKSKSDPTTASIDDSQCSALTAKGTRCRNKAKDDGYCSTHQNLKMSPVKSPTTPSPGGI